MQPFLHAIIILLIAASAAVACDPYDDGCPFAGDVIVGPLHRHSVLIYSGPFNGTSFEWHGHNRISRFEIRRPYAVPPDGNLLINGGVFADFLQFWSSNGDQFNGTLRIFSEPTNLTIGCWSDDDSEVMHLERISGAAPLRYSYRNKASRSIAGLELWDVTNGTGAYIVQADDGQLAGGSVSLVIGSLLFRGHVDFVVRIFAEPRSRPAAAHDLEVGQMRAGSDLISSTVLRDGADVNGDGFFSRAYEHFTVDLVRFTDLSQQHGAGGWIAEAHIDVDKVWAFFDSDAGRRITYLLEVYGRPMSTDASGGEQQAITVGELRPSSVLLEDINVAEIHSETSVVVVVRQLRLPIDRIEVRNAGSGAHIRPKLLSGVVGGSLLVLVFEGGDAKRPDEIRFTVKVWGSEP